MRRFAYILALLVCGYSSSVHAQLAPGYSGFSSAPTSASEAEYWSMMRRLGGCLADSKKDMAIAFLVTEPGSDEEDTAFRPLFHRNSNRCMGNFVSASMLRAHVRGSIAEGLFEQMSAADRAVGFAVPIDSPEDVRTLHQFAECYVAGNRDEAIAFLEMTKVGTKGEAQAVRQMAANFGPCLPEGVEVKIVPIDIRMAVAEALYHSATRRPVSVEQVAN